MVVDTSLDGQVIHRDGQSTEYNPPSRCNVLTLFDSMISSIPRTSLWLNVYQLEIRGPPDRDNAPRS